MLFRQHLLRTLALSDSQISLAFLAVGVGLFSGALITLMRLAIEWPLATWFMDSPENFESLSAHHRGAFLLVGFAALVLIFRLIPSQATQVGVLHVLNGIERHQGYLPLKNIIVQALTVVVALISGFSVGREGPAIHLGAGAGSQIGQKIGVTHHRLLILVGCGVASAISAAFNTPMAGVIFAMEVILMSYDKRAFIPIILSSVVGALVMQLTFGDSPAFMVPPLDIHSMLEIPGVLLLGMLCGVLSAAILWLIARFSPAQHWPIVKKWGVLTLATAVIAVPLPQVMGIGYDTVNLALTGKVTMLSLLGLLLFKVLLTSWAAATRFPAGTIGPLLFIGAMLGAAMGEGSVLLWPEAQLSVGFYTMLGMGAMMGATLGAPLAALVALLELTANPNVILPGMLVIVIATLTRSEVFKQPSLFNKQRKNATSHQRHQIQQTLRASWVRLAMEPAQSVNQQLNIEDAENALLRNTQWLCINECGLIVPARALQELLDDTLYREQHQDDIDLMDLVEHHIPTHSTDLRMSLHDALATMRQQKVSWLSLYDSRTQKCVGVVSRDHIYQFLTHH